MLLNLSDILQKVICFSLLSLNDFYFRFWKKMPKIQVAFLRFFCSSVEVPCVPCFNMATLLSQCPSDSTHKFQETTTAKAWDRVS